MDISSFSHDHPGYYAWGNGCEGWKMLDTNSLSVIRERMPPGTAEQLHYHSKAQQLFFILAGEATFEVETTLYKIIRDQSMHILPGKKHLIRNDGKEDLIFLLISEPSSKNDRTNL